jgi:nucleoside-diphosphate-sugar epimerase
MNASARLLVTGASGFVGARVTRLALDRGLAVTALVGPQSRLDRLAPVLDDVEVVRADVADERALGAAVRTIRPDATIHLAAAGAVVREDAMRLLLDTNALAPATLASALARVGCRRLVTVGSSSEYGTPEGPMDERLAALPDDPYGVAKLAGGLLARIAAREGGMESTHLRLFSVYGPGEDPVRLVASVVTALLAGRPMDLTPGNQVRDFVFVDDVADGLLRAIDAPALDGLTCNLGSGEPVTVAQLCRTVADLTGADPALLRFGARPYRAGERFAWRAETTRAQLALGWRATTSLSDGLTATIAAHASGFASSR